MERTAALALTNRIEATWSTGRQWTTSRLDAWTEALTDLDQGAAGTAFVRLRNTHTATPSIAEFIAAVRALHVDDASTHDICDACDDTGWTRTDDLVANTGTDREYRNTQVVPCVYCEHGRAAERSTAWTQRDSSPLKGDYTTAPADA